MLTFNTGGSLGDTYCIVCKLYENAQNEKVYDRHCVPAVKGSFDSMLEFLRLAAEYIPDTTATAIDGLEGVDIDACESKAKQLGVKFRRRVLDIVG